MAINIINDCQDPNAVARQVARAAALLDKPVNLIGVDTDLEAAGNLVDLLDAVGEHNGLVLANVAPRHRDAKKRPNGSPFGYFHYKNILVITTVDGLILSLVKKFNLVDKVEVIEIPSTLDKMIESGIMTREQRDHIVDSQFRSFDFLPRVAAHITRGREVISQKMDISQVKDAPRAIWWVDNFGNCKTTLTLEDVGKPNGQVDFGKLGMMPFYRRLKDVPDGEVAVVIGSSGIDQRRFLEIVMQGKSAADKLNLKSGDIIFEAKEEVSARRQEFAQSHLV